MRISEFIRALLTTEGQINIKASNEPPKAVRRGFFCGVEFRPITPTAYSIRFAHAIALTA